MLDIKFIRDNKDLIALGAKKKHIVFNVEELVTTDDERREALAVIEQKRAEQNAMSDKIVSAPDAEERNKMIAEMKTLKTDLQKKEEVYKEILKKWQTLMLQVPNIPDFSVPEGEDDSGNVEVRKWGTIRDFSKETPAFTPKNQVELTEALGMADFEKGAKVAGFRGYFLKNDGFTLNFAIWRLNG